MNLCLGVVVLFPVGMRLQSAEVQEGGEKVEQDLAYSRRANNLGQGDVVEALEVNRWGGYCFNVIRFFNHTKSGFSKI